MSEELDNPVWHALTGRQAHVALGHGRARHFPRDMAPFSAIESTRSLKLQTVHIAQEVLRTLHEHKETYVLRCIQVSP